MRRALRALGSFGFGWQGDRDPKSLYEPTRAQLIGLLGAIAPKPTSADLLLLYYTGHGFVGMDGDLVLGLKGSTIDGPPESGHLSRIVHETQVAGFKRLILILDCCHAGLTAPLVQLSGHPSYFLMAATGPGHTYFDDAGSPFTRALVDALGVPYRSQLRDPLQNAATFERWFTIAAQLMVTPPTSGGTLGNTILFPERSTLKADFDKTAPVKSLYSKLYLLLGLLAASGGDAAGLRDRIRRERVRAFQIVGADDRPSYVSREKVVEYLRLAKELGFASERGGSWSLTAQGRRALAGDGAQFNDLLQEGVFATLPAELSANALRAALFDLLQSATLPTVLEIERLLHKKHVPSVPPRRLRVALRLLAYSGVIQRTSSDSFFPR